MSSNAERLAEAISAKDQVEGFLANLEKLKSEEDIDEEQYLSTRKDYYRRLGAATSEIARIKNELKEQLAASAQSLELYRKKLASLDVKRKVGEFSETQYQAAGREAQSEINRLEQDVQKLNTLINASSAADIPVPEKRTSTRAPKPATTARENSGAKAPPGEPIAPVKGTGLSRGKLLALIGGVAVVVIAVVAGFLLLTGDKDRAVPPGKGVATIDIPVNIRGATGIGSLQFDLVYDSNALLPVDVDSGALPEDALFEYRLDAPGRVIVGIVYARGISGDVSVASVTFKPKGETKQSTPLNLENISALDASTMSPIQASTSTGSYANDGTYVAPAIVFSVAGK